MYVEGQRVGDVAAGLRFDHEPVFLYRLDVLGPLVHQRNVLPGP